MDNSNGGRQHDRRSVRKQIEAEEDRMELRTRLSLLARNAVDLALGVLRTKRMDPPAEAPAPQSWPSRNLRFNSLPGSQYVRRAARFFRHK